MASIRASGLRKAYGNTVALDGVDLTIDEGRIVGLIGPNGAGKSTLLNAVLGLTRVDGTLEVLGRDPWNQRQDVMQDVCFIADVAVLPRWMRVWQAIDYVAGVHPRFDRARADAFIAKTTIKRKSRIKDLSKGMTTQLHLALVMAIDARLLVLDEPTLGLDILFRKQFYDSLLNDYFDGGRTIVITTHQVEEIEHVLTDLVFIDRGRIVLSSTMDALARYQEVIVPPDHLARARALGPIQERTVIGRTVMLFDGVDPTIAAGLGDTRTPSVTDLFVALMGRDASTEQRRGSMSAVIDPAVPNERAPATRPAGKLPLARLVYWSIRRELWESSMTVGAPIAVALLLVVAFALGATNVASLTVNLPNFSFDSASDMTMPLITVSAVIVFAVAFIVSFTYSSEALYGERRDRTILFWKSLPVSDTVTVVSKALVPLLVLPILAWVTIVVLQVVLLGIWAIVLQVHGAAMVWSAATVVHAWGLALYGVFAAALWYLPVYGWLLLVSAWVPRSPFFLASLAVGVVPLVERIVFGSRVVGDYLGWRLFHSHFGNPIVGVDGGPVANVAGFFASPHLWTGIVFGVACLYAAIVLRRSRQPI